MNKKTNSHFEFLLKNKQILNSKRSQHEIVGFVIIVIIMVIIGLFLLVFYIKQPSIEYENQNIANFLKSSMLLTTDCVISQPNYENIEDLIKDCYENKKCLDDKMACEVLEDNLSELISESWQVGPDKPENSYSLVIYYKESNIGMPGFEPAEPSEYNENTESGYHEEILTLNEGECIGSKTGAEHIIHKSPGKIIVNMEICYTS